MMSTHSVSHCMAVLATVIFCVFLMLPSAELVLNFPNTRIITPNERLDRCHQCDQKYFRHYETKLCIPVYDEGCKCPKRFDCPELPTDVDTTGLNRSIRNVGRCQGLRFVACLFKEFEFYVNYSTSDSKAYYLGEVEPTCEFEGKKYYLGQQMDSEENHCLTCLCDKNFQDKYSTSCRIYDCKRELEKELPLLKRGCIPIYHEETCCPTEFRCPYGNEVRKPGPNARFAFNELDPLSHCTFNGKRFSIGDEMDISHPTNCVTCTCTNPPDITCIRRSCKSPPNYKHRNCQSIYIPGQCCSKHICT